MSSPLPSLAAGVALTLLSLTWGVMATRADAPAPASAAPALSRHLDYSPRLSPTPIACDANTLKHCLDTCYAEYGADPKNPQDPGVLKCQSLCHASAGCAGGRVGRATSIPG